MSFSVSISLTGLGANTGPFNLLSNASGSFVVFMTSVSKSLIASPAIFTVLVPDNTTIIRVQSTGTCTTYIDLFVIGGPLPPTTTTSTTITPPTTTTTTLSGPTTTTTTLSGPTTTTTTSGGPTTTTTTTSGGPTTTTTTVAGPTTTTTTVSGPTTTTTTAPTTTTTTASGPTTTTTTLVPPPPTTTTTTDSEPTTSTTTTAGPTTTSTTTAEPTTTTSTTSGVPACVGYVLDAGGLSASIEWFGCDAAYHTQTFTSQYSICTDGSGYTVTSGFVTENSSAPC